MSPPSPPLPPSEPEPEPAGTEMLLSAKPSLLAFPEAILTAPAAAPRSPNSNRMEPGFPSAEVP